MARRVHAEGQRERQRMANHDPRGKWAVGYEDDDGWHHITQMSSKQEAHETANRLDDPDETAKDLIGLTGDEKIEIRQR
jgi:hypothetical protein